MVGESKILTVSYGTFSCTLEGFDEPFSTMKAIAEYFRDLAADDRYFGAEPPTPDTEMLHKIAERTIQRRVAAELAENGVILRQTEASQTAASDTPALAVEMPKAEIREQQSPAPKAQVMASVIDVPAETPVSAQQTPVRAKDVVDDIVDDAPQSTAPDTQARQHIAQASQGGGDTVAEKLQRIRAVVARENAASDPYSEDQHAEDFGEDFGASGFEGASASSALFETPIETNFDDISDDISAAYEEDSTATISDVIADLARDGDQETGQPEVATNDTLAEIVEKVTETEVTTDVETLVETAVDDTNILDAVATKVEVEAEEVVEEVAEAIIETPRVEVPEIEVEAPVVEVTEVPEAKVETPEVEVAEAPEVKVETPEIEVAEAAEIEVEVSEPVDVIKDTEAEAAQEITKEETPVQAKPRRRIVVQKISRADMDAAKAAKASELPPEMEAELMAELAEVEAETTAVPNPVTEQPITEQAATTDEPQDDEADDIMSRLTQKLETPVEVEAVQQEEIAPETAQSDDDMLKGLLDDAKESVVDATDIDAPKRKSFAALAEDEAIERLMDTTGSRLDNDESSVRRASIAHLKAAVAATKADSSIAEAADKRDEEELGQYRDDLARVVRPSRPTSAPGGRADRPAPLVLISEQRIDHSEEAIPAVAATAATIDVRPRRVTRGNLALQEDLEEQFDTDADGNIFTDETQITFEEYAAKAGALDLPDLLEAAAGHYADIEKTAIFTRPMLMRKLKLISGPDAPSREDALRAFGTLLRTGKLVKADNGKFELSKSSRFA